MKGSASEKSRHLVLRAEQGELLPDALVAALREHGVACGWVRASGVVTDLELRAFRSETGTHAAPRKIAGPVQLVSVEGSVGLASGTPSVCLRAIVARETDGGLDTLAGEIAAARVVALEVLVTALDDVAMPHARDPRAGVWLWGPDGQAKGGAPVRAPEPAWAEAMQASAADAGRRAPTATAPTGTQAGSAGIPARPARPQQVDSESPVPEAGDIVDHFAFGRCDVVKSDGDRLHLRVGKDTRVREIALEMLRVTPLPQEGDKRVYKLERKL